MKKIIGWVCSGRGKAKGHFSEVAPEISERTGFKIVHGSLNLVLEAPIRLNEKTAYLVGGGRRMLWVGTLNDHPILIYRWRNAPLHVVEILSSKHIKSAFGIRDGDKIEFEVDASVIGDVAFLEKVFWTVIWGGRKTWFYSNDLYATQTEKMSRRLGCAQKKGWL